MYRAHRESSETILCERKNSRLRMVGFGFKYYRKLLGQFGEGRMTEQFVNINEFKKKKYCEAVGKVKKSLRNYINLYAIILTLKC